MGQRGDEKITGMNTNSRSISSSSNRQFKTLRVTLETYNRLAKLGDLKDSFDTVIRKLMDGNLSAATAAVGQGQGGQGQRK